MSVLLPARAYRWNYTVMGLDISLFSFALSFASWYGVLPLFVANLTASPFALGALPALRAVALLPPLFVAGLTERLPQKKPFVLLVTVFERLPYLVLAVATPLLATGNPTALLWLTFAMLAVVMLAAGVANPAWLDLIARMLPDDWRGRFFGYSFALGGLFGVAGGAGAAWLLRQHDWIIGTALCFACAFVALIASFLFLVVAREPAHAPTEARHPRTSPIPTRLRERVPALLREDRNLRWYLVAVVLITGAGAATAFFTVDAKRTLGLTDGEAGAYATLILLASTVGNVLWGYAGDRFGHKRVLEMGACATGLASALALVARDAEWGRVGYGAVFLLVGLGSSAVQITALTFIVDFAPPGQRPTYIGLATLVQLPFAVGAPLLAAWLANWQGYAAVFAVTALLAVAGATITFGRVRDPRVAARPVPA